jgi:hypothetical protein
MSYAERDKVNKLQQEKAAADALRSSLLKLDEDMDRRTIRDTIEGETELRDAIEDVLAMVTDAEAMSEGLGLKIADMQARQKRYDDRVSFLRTTIEQAMVIGDIKKLELPEATLSLGNRAPKLVVSDESLIPPAYFKQPDPVLDKKAITDALKAKLTVPGASLGNGSVSLTIRRA